MTDRTTKALLLALTVGVWLNILTPLFQATPVQAQSRRQFNTIERHLGRVVSALADINRTIMYVGDKPFR
jgi:hypothetical protein